MPPPLPAPATTAAVHRRSEVEKKWSAKRSCILVMDVRLFLRMSSERNRHNISGLSLKGIRSTLAFRSWRFSSEMLRKMISRTRRCSLDPRQRVAWHSAARQKTRHSKQPHVQLSILHLWTWCEYDRVADLSEQTMLILGSTCGRRHRSLLSTSTHHFKSSSVIPTKCYQSSNAFVSDIVSHASVISASVKDKTATWHLENGHQVFHILHLNDLGARG